MTQVKTFNPIRLEKGQFRIALDLTALGEQAWDILKAAENLGFPSPRFRQGENTMWAVLVEEQRSFESNSMEDLIVAWDQNLDKLRSLLPEPNLNLLVVGRFKQDLIAA